jgi:hypothetical protein
MITSDLLVCKMTLSVVADGEINRGLGVQITISFGRGPGRVELCG